MEGLRRSFVGSGICMEKVQDVTGSSLKSTRPQLICHCHFSLSVTASPCMAAGGCVGCISLVIEVTGSGKH